MIADYLASEKIIEHGGRTFVARRPTVATVLMFVELYAAEIEALVKLHEAGSVDLSTDDSRASFVETVRAQCVDASQGRIEVVLATCVELWQGRPGEVLTVLTSSLGLAETLSRAVLAQSDLGRIVGSIDLSQLASSSLADGGGEPDRRPSLVDEMATAQEVSMVRMAREFNCRPDAISTWPYVLWLSVMQALNQLNRPTPQDAPPPIEADTLPGLSVVEVEHG